MAIDNISINSFLSRFSSKTKYIVGTALVLIFLLFLWLFLTKGINGISNFFFWRKANAERAKVEQQLKKAEDQQKIIDQTLKDLAASKEELAKAVKAREDAERIFNDQSKTAKQKLAEYEKAMSDAPIHTDPTGVTTNDLCERAKASGSNPELIQALCGQ